MQRKEQINPELVAPYFVSCRDHFLGCLYALLEVYIYRYITSLGNQAERQRMNNIRVYRRVPCILRALTVKKKRNEWTHLRNVYASIYVATYAYKTNTPLHLLKYPLIATGHWEFGRSPRIFRAFPVLSRCPLSYGQIGTIIEID